MEDLIWLINTVTLGHDSSSLQITSFISFILAVLVITVKNPITSILYLIGLFFTIASYLCLLGATFIGLSYILVYVGAISVLFIFILMLLNIRVSDLTVNTTNSILLVILVTVFFYFASSDMLPYQVVYDFKYKYIDKLPIFDYLLNSTIDYEPISDSEYYKIYFVSSNSWDGNIAETSLITTIGNMLFTSNIVWILLISWILLLAMVGCIMITL